MNKEMVNLLIKGFGQTYSDTLGIDLKRGGGEVFEWFLASILFGAPIMETSVRKTYKCFEKHKVLTPEKVLETGWPGLVDILDEGSYTRYDFKSATKLLGLLQKKEMQTMHGQTSLFSCYAGLIFATTSMGHSLGTCIFLCHSSPMAIRE